MAMEEKITEILDRLTEEIKVEDAAVLVGGFYAGMNGYTPLSALMKMGVAPGNDIELYKKVLRAYFLANGVFIPLLLDSLPEEKEAAVSDKSISLDDIDPRKKTLDYLYERRQFLKEMVKSREAMIEELQKHIADQQGYILNDQALIESENQLINKLKLDLGAAQTKLANAIADMKTAADDYARVLKGFDDQIATFTADIKKLMAAPPSPQRDEIIAKLTAAIEKLQHDRAIIVTQYAIYSNDLYNKKVAAESEIRQIQTDINGHYQHIAALRASIETEKANVARMQKDLDALLASAGEKETEIRKIDYELLKIKTSLGLIGMIEAYAITRPGTISGIGDIIKGIGDIIPG